MSQANISASAGPDPILMQIEGGFNLRDFGGHGTRDSGRIRFGMLYRSGTMVMLDDAGEAYLRRLGVRTICDLRRPNERTAEPTRWHMSADVDYWARDYTEVSGVLAEVLKSADMSADGMRAAMTQLYRDILRDHAPSYSYLFQLLAERRGPVLINCSAGKDRTGVAAALVLTALGVAREDVERDYLATNAHANWDLLLTRRSGTRVARAAKSHPEALAPLLRADKVYLDAMFAELDERWGGIDGYLGSIGIDTAAVDRIRAYLLH